MPGKAEAAGKAGKKVRQINVDCKKMGAVENAENKGTYYKAWNLVWNSGLNKAAERNYSGTVKKQADKACENLSAVGCAEKVYECYCGKQEYQLKAE